MYSSALIQGYQSDVSKLILTASCQVRSEILWRALQVGKLIYREVEGQILSTQH